MNLLERSTHTEVTEAQARAREALNDLLDAPTTTTMETLRDQMLACLHREELWLAHAPSSEPLERARAQHREVSAALDTVLRDVPGSSSLLERAFALRRAFLEQVVLIQRCH